LGMKGPKGLAGRLEGRGDRGGPGGDLVPGSTGDKNYYWTGEWVCGGTEKRYWDGVEAGVQNEKIGDQRADSDQDIKCSGGTHLGAGVDVEGPST